MPGLGSQIEGEFKLEELSKTCYGDGESVTEDTIGTFKAAVEELLPVRIWHDTFGAGG